MTTDTVPKAFSNSPRLGALKLPLPASARVPA